MNPVEVIVSKPHTFKRVYHFWLNGQEVAVLNYTKRFGNEATIRLNNETWNIKTTGFWKRFVELSAEQSPYTKHKLACGWSFKVPFAVNSRESYQFRSRGFWKRIWFWEDAGKNEVIGIQSNGFSKKNRGTITFNQPITNNLLLTALLGWYMVMAYEEMAAASAAA